MPAFRMLPSVQPRNAPTIATLRRPMEYADNILRINGIAVTELASTFGTPLYVYDAAVIRRQIGRVR